MYLWGIVHLPTGKPNEIYFPLPVQIACLAFSWDGFVFYAFMPKDLQIFFKSFTDVNASEKNSEGPSKGLFAKNAAFLAVPIISFIKMPFFTKSVCMILDFSLMPCGFMM